MQKKRCVNAAAYYIKELYKIREYTMIKKTKERKKKKMDGSFLCVAKSSSLSSWSRGKVFKKRQLGSSESLPLH